MSITNSNQPHMDNLRFMVLMVDDYINVSMPDINGEYYFPLVTELENAEYEEGPGYYDRPE